MEAVLHAPETLPSMEAWDRAEMEELAFWRHVAYVGYDGYDPRCFRHLQRLFMTKWFMLSTWSIAELGEASIVEIGCGPLGMIEYLPAKRRVAYDPLNASYSTLFSRVRSPDIEYTTDFEGLLRDNQGAFDLGICFNVLDHTSQPRWFFDSLLSLIKPNGRFLLQVNTVREGFPRSAKHAEMHPSPFTTDQIRSWLADYSAQFEERLEDTPSAENEFFYMAWGHKRLGFWKRLQRKLGRMAR